MAAATKELKSMLYDCIMVVGRVVDWSEDIERWARRQKNVTIECRKDKRKRLKEKMFDKGEDRFEALII